MLDKLRIVFHKNGKAIISIPFGVVPDDATKQKVCAVIKMRRRVFALKKRLV